LPLSYLANRTVKDGSCAARRWRSATPSMSGR
jgi:hypothetical protein